MSKSQYECYLAMANSRSTTICTGMLDSSNLSQNNPDRGMNVGRAVAPFLSERHNIGEPTESARGLQGPTRSTHDAKLRHDAVIRSCIAITPKPSRRKNHGI